MAEAGQLLDAIQTGLPAARIYVVGPLGRYGVLTSQDLPSVAGLSDACASRGIPFFDTTANGFWFNPANDHTYFSGVTATATAVRRICLCIWFPLVERRASIDEFLFSSME